MLERIAVTAQRRAQEAKDVPVSIRVLSREEIEERIVRRLDDAFAATANANMTSQRGGNDASDISIRGLATTAFGADPSVGIYVDDVYVGNDNGFNLRTSDMEQIEVLRGPQGTLYGRNALGGAVNIRTASPELGVNTTTLEMGVGTDAWCSAVPGQTSPWETTLHPVRHCSATAATAGFQTPRAVPTTRT